MDCAKLRERIAPLLDGELEPADERAACEHLDRCPACAALVESAAGVTMPGPAAPVPESPEFWAAMDRALEEEAGRPTPWTQRLRSWWSAEVRVSRGAVALYLGLLAAAFLWHLVAPSGPPSPPAGVAAVEPSENRTPAASPPPATRPSPQRVQKASYEPIQQMY